MQQRALIFTVWVALMPLAALAGCDSTGLDTSDTELHGALRVVPETGHGSDYFLAEKHDRRIALEVSAAVAEDFLARNGVRLDHLGGDSVCIRGAYNATGHFAVQRVDRLVTTEGVAVARSPLVTVGKKSVAALLVSTSDKPFPFSNADVREWIFSGGGSVDAFLTESSYGKAGIGGILDAEGDVFGPFAAPVAASSCDYWEATVAAESAAAAAGIELAPYEHVVVYLPGFAGCEWAGLGEMPGRYTWINGVDSWGALGVIGHELGHNFFLPHASARRCTSGGDAVPLSDACTDDEYGDMADIMGFGPGHYSAFNKEQLGWLTPEQITVTSSPGRYRIASLEGNDSGTVSLRVPTTGGFFYAIEWRRAVGFDAAVDAGLRGGVEIRLVSEQSYTNTYLLDMHPETDHVLDAALNVGASFSSPRGDFSINVVGVTDTYAEVDLQGGGPSDADSGSADTGAADTGSGDTGGGNSGPEGYTWCAHEGDSFTLSGMADVAYGANGSFNYLYGQTGRVDFNNSTFGDPLSGVVKSGYYKLVGTDSGGGSGDDPTADTGNPSTAGDTGIDTASQTATSSVPNDTGDQPAVDTEPGAIPTEASNQADQGASADGNLPTDDGFAQDSGRDGQPSQDGADGVSCRIHLESHGRSLITLLLAGIR